MKKLLLVLLALFMVLAMPVIVFAESGSSRRVAGHDDCAK